MSWLGRRLLEAKRERAIHAALGNRQHVADRTRYIHKLIIHADWAIWD